MDRGPKFRKQTGVRKSGSSLTDIRITGWMTEYQEVTSLVKNRIFDWDANAEFMTAK